MGLAVWSQGRRRKLEDKTREMKKGWRHMVEERGTSPFTTGEERGT